MPANAVHTADETDFLDAISQLFASQIHTVSAVDVDGFRIGSPPQRLPLPQGASCS
jgi:hypothetical protein